MYRLKRSKGFPQRHIGARWCTSYLKSLDYQTGYWRSPVTLDLIRQDVQAFDNPKVIKLNDAWTRAISKTADAFDLQQDIPMLHLNDLFRYDLNIWAKSPCLPWIQHGYRSKSEVRDDPKAVERIRWFWHRVKNSAEISAPDCCAFVRSHLTDAGDSKVRAVWGYPMTVTMGEAVFAVPLIEAYQTQRGHPIAYGYETAVGGVRKLIDEISGPGWYCALDFKSFDKTVPALLIEYAFKILSQNIDFGNYRWKGVARAKCMLRMYEYLKRYFINTPIRLSNGERYRKRSGVASGSYFTQLIDSIINYLIITWLCLETQGEFPEYLRVLGDDSVMRLRRPLDLNKVQELLSSIGMMLNLEKCVQSENLSELTFLGYQISYGLPSKPFNKWMASLLYPEYPDESWDDVASRATGLLYANMGCDHQFDQLCRTIITQRDFVLKLKPDLKMRLQIMGFKEIKHEPPDRFYFLTLLKAF